MNTLKLHVSIENKLLETVVEIDDDPIKWGYVNLFDFFIDLLNKGINVPSYGNANTRIFYYNQQISTFEPFTCSCGVAGCAGIWSGIMTKHRKHTVEWKSNKDDGYQFINRFYSFDKEQYISAIRDAYNQLQVLSDSDAVVDSYDEDVLLKDSLKHSYRWKEIKEYFKQR